MGWQKCVCSGCCFMLQSKPNSQLSGSSCPCAPGARQLHTGSSPSLVTKQESLLSRRAKWSKEQGRAGMASSPGCTEWLLWALLPPQTLGLCDWVTGAWRALSCRRCRNPRGFEEAGLAPSVLWKWCGTTLGEASNIKRCF